VKSEVANPCWINYKTLTHKQYDETNYSVGLEVHYYDLNDDGATDTLVYYQILTEGQADLVYSLNTVPLFIALDVDQDGEVDIMGVYDDEMGTCKIY